jgi:hypothetical protein
MNVSQPMKALFNTPVARKTSAVPSGSTTSYASPNVTPR